MYFFRPRIDGDDLLVLCEQIVIEALGLTDAAVSAGDGAVTPISPVASAA